MILFDVVELYVSPILTGNLVITVLFGVRLRPENSILLMVPAKL
jgi:hypothetical protein